MIQSKAKHLVCNLDILILGAVAKRMVLVPPMCFCINPHERSARWAAVDQGFGPKLQRELQRLQET